jgi:ABC-type nickel/cobalt efflux system permease component RcnA
MEIVDTSFMFVVPGAMNAHIDQSLFWMTLAGSLVIAGLAAYPVNRWLISGGRGHAIIHDSHHTHSKNHSTSHSAPLH